MFVESTDWVKRSVLSSPVDGQSSSLVVISTRTFHSPPLFQVIFPYCAKWHKNAYQFGEIASAHYGGKDGTCSKEMQPKTCPLVTLNWEALDRVAQYYR